MNSQGATKSISLLMECEQRLEGITGIIGALACSDGVHVPELDIVHEALVSTVSDMKRTLATYGEDLE